MTTTDATDARSTEEEQHDNRQEDTEKAMSEANITPDDEQNEYQVAVWVKREFIIQVSADSEQDAKDEAREFVCMEHGIATRDIQSATHESVLDGGQHQVSVWAKQEIIETVTAESEQSAEEKAREFVCMEYGIATRDIQSTNVEDIR